MKGSSWDLTSAPISSSSFSTTSKPIWRPTEWRALSSRWSPISALVTIVMPHPFSTSTIVSPNSSPPRNGSCSLTIMYVTSQSFNPFWILASSWFASLASPGHAYADHQRPAGSTPPSWDASRPGKDRVRLQRLGSCSASETRPGEDHVWLQRLNRGMPESMPMQRS